MIASDLAMSVFQQTTLPITADNLWWVETILQKMKINGLVKMINASKKLEVGYIEGYKPRYKWAYRDVVFDISHVREAWEILCSEYLIESFPWIAWHDIIFMTDIGMLRHSIQQALKSNVRHISYVAKIYANSDITKNVITSLEEIEMKSDTISNMKSGEWLELRKCINI